MDHLADGLKLNRVREDLFSLFATPRSFPLFTGADDTGSFVQWDRRWGREISRWRVENQSSRKTFVWIDYFTLLFSIRRSSPRWILWERRLLVELSDVSAMPWRAIKSDKSSLDVPMHGHLFCSQTLETIDLSWNNTGSAGMDDLADGLKMNRVGEDLFSLIDDVLTPVTVGIDTDGSKSCQQLHRRRGNPFSQWCSEKQSSESKSTLIWHRIHLLFLHRHWPNWI